MTESKQNEFFDFKDFFYIFHKEELEEEPKNVSIDIPFKRSEEKSRNNESTNDEVDLINKKRAIKRWKQSFGYYCLHPEKFKFGIKNLK